MESSRGADRRRVRLDVSAGSVFGSRSAALDGYCERWLGLQTLDYAKGPAGIVSARALRIAGKDSRCGTFAHDAGEGEHYSRTRARPPPHARAAQRRAAVGGDEAGAGVRPQREGAD